MNSLSNQFATMGKRRPVISASDITDGLVLWLKSFSSSTATDSSGNGNDGTIFGSPSIVSGPNGGQAVTFDGSVYIECGADSSIADVQNQGGGGMTISCWVNPVSAAPIIGKNGNSFGWLRWDLENSGRIGFSKDGSDDLFARSQINSWTADVWQFLAVTWDGSGTAANVIHYRDGLVKTHDLNDDGADFKSDAALNLLIGRYQGTPSGSFFSGILADFRIYNRALTSTEIATLYANGAK